MVSFFFTPIYMFILVFVVSFGTKKGTLATYSSAWSPVYSSSNFAIFRYLSSGKVDIKSFIKLQTYRFQHTALTSRPTVYVLVAFWCFFFFFGESLLLLTFNYNTLVDLIPSGFFVFTKSHAVFMTHSSNALLGDTIFFFILFFTTTAGAFLLNLKYTYTYSYTKLTAFVDLASCLLVLYFFSPYFLLTLVLVQILRTSRVAALK